MKKRIISIALVVVMIVAMIPATLLTATAAAWTGNNNGYDVYLSTTELTLDGEKDAVYENSEKIISASCTNSSVYFEAYAVATTTGIYVFADIKDNDVDYNRESGESDIASSDKVQFYTQINDGATDAEGNPAYNWVYQYEEYDYGHDKTKQKGNTVKSIITDDGYTIEIFKPWSDYALATLTLEKANFYFGLQVNNYVGSTNNGIAYDNKACSSYWGYAPNYPDYKGFKYYMTKANLITEPKAEAVVNNNYYTANIVDYADITFDGKMDEAYNFSGKIEPTYAHAGTIGKDVDFDAYTLATEKGIYVFASIMDDSIDKKEEVDPRDGDKFQISFSLGNTYWTRWGYVDFDYVNGGRHVVTAKSSNGFGGTVDVEQKVSIWDNNKGWDIEVYIPYEFCADTLGGNIGYSSGVLSQNDLVFKMNIQVNNTDVLAIGDDGRAAEVDNHGQIYDVKAATGSWSSSSSHVPVKFARHEGFGQLIYAPSISMDGVKDAGYGDDSTAFVFDGRVPSNVSSSCEHALNTSGKAWVAVTNTGIYVYAEFTDTDINATNNPDGLRLDVAFPMSGAHGYVGNGYHHSGHYTGSYTWESTTYRSTFWQITGASADDRLGARSIDLGNGKYAIEFGLALPHYEQELMKAGKSFPIAIGLTYNDCCTTKNGTCAKQYSSTHWNYWENASPYRVNMPRWTADQSVTTANASVVSKISSANVVLGESINIKYNVDLPVTALNAVMKFTFNDKVTYVPVTRTGNTTGEVLFEDIAPQCMGDNIKAELYVDGVKADSVDEYSVKQNVTSVKNTDNEALVDALLLYGAAAQQYTNYKATETELVADLNALAIDASIYGADIKVVDGNALTTAKIAAAGVHFANVNKLYVKVEATDLTGVTFTATKNGNPIDIELTERTTGVYYAYTDGIKATEFGDVYTFTITDADENYHTLTYSVNSYAYAKVLDDPDNNIGVLTTALYNYGAAAAALN